MSDDYAAFAARRTTDGQLVRRLDRIEAAAEKLSRIAFNSRFASGRGLAAFTSMDAVAMRKRRAERFAVIAADRAYRRTTAAA
jgi:hypothetical protein